MMDKTFICIETQMFGRDLYAESGMYINTFNFNFINYHNMIANHLNLPKKFNDLK